ncbi:hypothetical protein BZA70DRAFT_310414 [Myxozyma melibiosi]|uniref:RING-type domain-containing protein n=1 Tax=Myxozyma melibiosi TaxID=54550 RepID=A0ABR1F7Z0_9ASCO
MAATTTPVTSVVIRTRVLGICVICDESLEYRLSHERVVELQCSGGHAAHGECVAATDSKINRAAKCTICSASVPPPTAAAAVMSRPVLPVVPVLPVLPLTPASRTSPPPPSVHSTRSRSPSRSRIPTPTVSITPASAAAFRSPTKEQCLSCLVRITIPFPESRPSTDANGSGENNWASVVASSGSSHIWNRNSVSTEAALRDLSARLDSSFKPKLSKKLGSLRMCGKRCASYPSSTSAQLLDCYLFDDHLLCVKEERTAATGKTPSPHSAPPPLPTLTVRTFISISKDLKGLTCDDSSTSLSPYALVLSLSSPLYPQLRLAFNQPQLRDMWKAEIIKSASASLGFTPPLNLKTAPPHIPVTSIVIFPLSDKLETSRLQSTISALLDRLGSSDRLGVVVYSATKAFSLPQSGPQPRSWKGWTSCISGIERALFSELGEPSCEQTAPARGFEHALSLLLDGPDAQQDSSSSSSSSRTTPIQRILLFSESLDSATGPLSDLERLSHDTAVEHICKLALDHHIVSYTFGIGHDHDASELVQFSNATRGTYTYLPHWTGAADAAIRCLAVCMSMSHRDLRVTLKIPAAFDGARILKVDGCLSYGIKSGRREAEVALGDTAFGDCKDVIVQLAMPPDVDKIRAAPREQWDMIVSDIQSVGDDFDDVYSDAGFEYASDYEQPSERSSIFSSPLQQQRFSETARYRNTSTSPLSRKPRGRFSSTTSSNSSTALSEFAPYSLLMRRQSSDTRGSEDEDEAGRRESAMEKPVLEAQVSYLQFSASRKRRTLKSTAVLRVPIMTVPADEVGLPSAPPPLPQLRIKQSNPGLYRKQSAAAIPKLPLIPQIPSALTTNTLLSQRRIELLTAESLLLAMRLAARGKPRLAEQVLRKIARAAEGLTRGPLPIPPSPTTTNYLSSLSAFSLNGSSSSKRQSSLQNQQQEHSSISSISSFSSSGFPSLSSSSFSPSLPAPRDSIKSSSISSTISTSSSLSTYAAPTNFTSFMSDGGGGGVDKKVSGALCEEIEYVLEQLYDPEVRLEEIEKRVLMVVDVIVHRRSCSALSAVGRLYCD